MSSTGKTELEEISEIGSRFAPRTTRAGDGRQVGSGEFHRTRGSCWFALGSRLRPEGSLRNIPRLELPWHSVGLIGGSATMIGDWCSSLEGIRPLGVGLKALDAVGRGLDDVKDDYLDYYYYRD